MNNLSWNLGRILPEYQLDFITDGEAGVIQRQFTPKN
jgi:hypothetical protein